MSNGISVVICCYNSESRLGDTLAALSKQQFCSIVDWEVLLIDNACTDQTVAKALETWNMLFNPAPMRVIRESKPGLTYARKAGIAHAKHEYILFCDDDNWLNPDYLEKGLLLMEANTSVAALGGTGIPIFETKKPEWFDDYQEAYAVGSQLLTKEKGKQLSLYGAGMIIRKSYYSKIIEYGFQELLNDRTGHSLSSSGDTELTNAFTIAGYELMASDSMNFCHYLTSNRLQPRYLIKLFTAFGTDGPVRNIYYSFQTEKKIFWLFRFWWFHFFIALIRMTKYLIKPPKKHGRRLYLNWSFAYIKRLLLLIGSYSTIYNSIGRFQQIAQSEAPKTPQLSYLIPTINTNQNPITP